MQIKMIRIEDIKPYENNPRNNQKAIKDVAESIKQFGFKVPIVLDQNYEIITGHTRVLAAKKLKLTEVPAIIADDLSPDKVKAFRLVDNKVAEIADWDIEKLMLELNEIEMDLSTFGFETEKTINDVSDDEFEMEVPKKPKSKTGDIYQLGKHRLICGDSTDVNVIERLMDNDIADMLLTDPPYNVNYEGGSMASRDKILNDHMADEEFFEFLKKAFSAAAFALKPGGGFYIYHADVETSNFRGALEANGLTVKQTLIWNKNTFTLGRQDYQWKHEPILYGWKQGAAHYFIDDRTWATVIDFPNKPIDPDKLTAKEAKELLKQIIESTQFSVLDENKPVRNADHPTMKPIALLARNILNSSRPNEAVLDIFGGSGSTLIAAEQLNRRCYMVEMDPKYIDVIIKRWEDFTGLKAEKIE